MVSALTRKPRAPWNVCSAVLVNRLDEAYFRDEADRSEGLGRAQGELHTSGVCAGPSLGKACCCSAVQEHVRAASLSRRQPLAPLLEADEVPWSAQ